MRDLSPARRAGASLLLLLLAVGCGAPPAPVYQSKAGFKFAPPPGWVERDRDNVLPARAGRKPPDLPMPSLTEGEKLLVRYDRVTAGRLAWVRASVIEPPAGFVLAEQIRAPGPDWKAESPAETLEVNGLPAARITYLGRCDDQDYRNETVAVRHGERVYVITASFPAGDTEAREQVRKAVAAASWK